MPFDCSQKDLEIFDMLIILNPSENKERKCGCEPMWEEQQQ